MDQFKVVPIIKDGDKKCFQINRKRFEIVRSKFRTDIRQYYEEVAISWSEEETERIIKHLKQEIKYY